MPEPRTIAFFTEAAYGPALNSVAIAQACVKLGHRPVFLTDPGMAEVYGKYGFEEVPVEMAEPDPEADQWATAFIENNLPNFHLSAYDQIDNYVLECWEAIVDTAIYAERQLPAALQQVRPDLICVDNAIMFPATKRYADEAGIPWVRIISCSENEIPDPQIPPSLSGCSQNDRAGFRKFEERFHEVIKPCHDRFNAFLKERGEAPYPIGQFFEVSPHLNLLLYPEAVKFQRSQALDPERFQYLEGCVRQEEPYSVPAFPNTTDPLLYVSFGSLGSGDAALLGRLIEALGKLPLRVLFNAGDKVGSFERVPANVHLESWFPQPSVIPQADAVIHHGGNNSFTECLFFGKPALVMPFAWDGHDNAMRVEETGHGFKLHRSKWTDTELANRIQRMLNDEKMQARLSETSAQMQAHHGPTRAAKLLDELLGSR